MINSLMDSDQVLATCPRCGQEHMIPRIPLWPGHMLSRVACPACIADQEKQQREEATSREWARRMHHWQTACPSLYQKTDPSRLPNEQLADVMRWQYGPKGLLLMGPTGSGKTRCAYQLLKRLALKEGRRLVVFDCAGFGHQCIKSFREGIGDSWVAAVARAEVVFLDDLGKMPFTGRVESELFTVIERRMANELPLIMTTNMNGDELAAKASDDPGKALVRRLRESCRSVVFDEQISSLDNGAH